MPNTKPIQAYTPKFLFALLLLALGVQQLAAAPTPPGHERTYALVYFTDKGPNAEALLAEPSRFLSPDAIERRALHGVAIDFIDLPVDGAYLSGVHQVTPILGKSKWLNLALVQLSEQDAAGQLAALYALPYIHRIDIRCGVPVSNLASNHEPVVDADPELGSSAEHLSLMGVDKLHAEGFRGAGIRIAFLDSGFDNVDGNPYYRKLFEDGRIVATWDFEDDETEVYRDHNHGAHVFSFVGADSAGSYVGGAPDAEFLLARTETVFSETPQEEMNWLEAAEWADSAGTWIISSSLGYNTFDDSRDNYTRAMMDGDFALISQAADLAASRGILVVVSAGNEGGSSWNYITAPCDADSVLCVGAVSLSGNIASFSSPGPSADGQIKPDVVAPGAMVNFVSRNGTISRGNGTSYACPNITGFAAALWSAHPDAKSHQVLKAIQRSGNRYFDPNDRYGYGLPNATLAEGVLAAELAAPGSSEISKPELKVYPNPANTFINVTLYSRAEAIFSVAIYDATGKMLHQQRDMMSGLRYQIPIDELTPGVYILKAKGQGVDTSERFIKN